MKFLCVWEWWTRVVPVEVIVGRPPPRGMDKQRDIKGSRMENARSNLIPRDPERGGGYPEAMAYKRAH
ncbi:hypothetical protein RB195_004903 [Necator americanus]|uniref:Uncharacterized protein n=1 Tax=Necator americanus TaxID=51031 RepID=A0ABR1BM81_NECAM